MRMYLLDKKQRVRRWLKDNDFIEAEMTEEINAANQINFSMPLKDRIADNIYYVAIPTPRSKQKYLLFKLLSERVQNDRIEYQGIEEAYDELKQYGYIKDIRPNDRTAEEMLKMVLEPTRWTLGNVPETNHQSTNFYYITYLEALQKIVGLFNIELTFEVTIDPKSNKITRRQVNVYNQQGQRTGKRFEYGSNLLTIEQEQDSQELITALVGRGKGEQVSEGHNDTPDGYGRRITFADVVWTKKDGNPVDKPAGQEYLVDPEATELYGFSDGKPRIGLTVFEDIEDPIELINATWKALQSLKRPKVSFKASVTDVGKLGLGDTVAIIRHDLKIEYFTRVYKVKHDLLNENNNQIELGDDFSSHSITNSIIKVDGIANEAKESANHAAIAANGKNNNYYSSVQPLAPIEGDIWYKDLGNGETDMYQYHNGGWVFIQSTRDLHVVENQVKEAQDGLNQAKADIITNKQKADADIENLNKSIEDNKKVADESLKKLNDSVTNLQGQYDNNVVPNLNKVMTDASDALQKYIAAQNSIADLTKQAQQQGKDIADVSNTVKGLNINYANLAGDVNSTKVDVKGLQTTIGTANGDIAQLKLDAQNLQTMLAGKVDNTTYTNFVNLTNQALNARLTASDLNGYAKTADLQATANGLKLNIDSVADQMNNLRVGGRNLIPNSGTDIVIESKTTDAWPAWCNRVIYRDLTPGETYTFSVSATNTNGVKEASIRIFNEAQNKEAPGSLVFPADGKRHSTTFTIPENGVSYSVWLYAGHMGKLEGKSFATTFHHPQLELGTATTDWRPNPDDTEHSLTELSARITANSQQFSSYYTKSETDNRTNDAKNGAINAIKGDGNWTGLSNILTNSGFLQTADGFLQKVQQTTVPMFNGGGVNLLKGTADFRPDNLWQPLNAWIRTNETYNGLTIFKGKTTEDWNGLCQYYPVKKGETYTFSLNARYESGTGKSTFYALLNSSQEGEYKAANTTPWSLDINLNENWQRRSFTFTATSDGYIKPRIERTDNNKNILEICGFKLERGTVATPWTPNPADMATQSAFSELSQSLEGLRSTVGSNYGSLQSQISQSSSTLRTELTDKIKGIDNKTTSTADSLNSVIGRVGSLENLTNFQVINNAINANNYTNTGNYFIQSTANTNVPGTNWCYLKVEKVNDGRIVQTWQADDDPTLRFVRTKIGDSWTNWQRAASYSEYSELNRTVQGLQSTVSSNYGQLQSLNTQTATAIRNEVTDKVNNLQGQITTQADNINLTIGSTGDLSNICRNPDFMDGSTNGWEDVGSSTGNGSSPSKYYGSIKSRDAYYGKWFPVAAGDKYYFSTYAWQDQSTNQFSLGLVYEKKDGHWEWQSGVTFAPNESFNTKTGSLTIPNYAVKARIWVHIEAYSDFGSWFFTNVNVRKNDTLAQINMSAGTTLIQNDKIYMDASSTIFSGNAFIPSAAITSLNADKITTGTLNAANVNIINLNANNITTGTINGQNLKIDLNTGNVEFQHGRIHNFSNTVDINLDQNYISTANYNTRALLKDGELQLTQPNIFDTNGNWYFRLFNGGGAGDAWAGASLIGRDSVIVANEANAEGATGFTSSPMGTATFSGLFTGKGTNNWMPTILGGAERGVFIKGGNQMSIKQNVMDPNDGGVFATGSPFISVGVDGPNNNWWGNRIVIDGEYLHVPTA